MSKKEKALASKKKKKKKKMRTSSSKKENAFSQKKKKRKKSQKKFLGPMVPASPLAVLDSPVQKQGELRCTKKNPTRVIHSIMYYLYIFFSNLIVT